MAVLCDRQIREMSIVNPCYPTAKRPGKLSYGLTSGGYDSRLGYKFKVFTPLSCGTIDPKNFDSKMYVEVNLSPEKTPFHNPNCYCGDIYNCGDWITTKTDHLLIPPHSFVLAETMETYTMPRDVIGVVLGKSSYARCGLVVCCTPIEPAWQGVITIELNNCTPLPIKVYPGEGIMQIVFHKLDQDCEISYADKDGIYLGQTGITDPRIRGLS